MKLIAEKDVSNYTFRLQKFSAPLGCLQLNEVKIPNEEILAPKIIKSLVSLSKTSTMYAFGVPKGIFFVQSDFLHKIITKKNPNDQKLTIKTNNLVQFLDLPQNHKYIFFLGVENVTYLKFSPQNPNIFVFNSNNEFYMCNIFSLLEIFVSKFENKRTFDIKEMDQSIFSKIPCSTNHPDNQNLIVSFSPTHSEIAWVARTNPSIQPFSFEVFHSRILENKETKGFSFEEPTKIQTSGPEEPVFSICFATNGNLLCLGSKDGKVIVLERQESEKPQFVKHKTLEIPKKSKYFKESYPANIESLHCVQEHLWVCGIESACENKGDPNEYNREEHPFVEFCSYFICFKEDAKEKLEVDEIYWSADPIPEADGIKYPKEVNRYLSCVSLNSKPVPCALFSLNIAKKIGLYYTEPSPAKGATVAVTGLSHKRPENLKILRDENIPSAVELLYNGFVIDNLYQYSEKVDGILYTNPNLLVCLTNNYFLNVWAIYVKADPSNESCFEKIDKIPEILRVIEVEIEEKKKEETKIEEIDPDDEYMAEMNALQAQSKKPEVKKIEVKEETEKLKKKAEEIVAPTMKFEFGEKQLQTSAEEAPTMKFEFGDKQLQTSAKEIPTMKFEFGDKQLQASEEIEVPTMKFEFGDKQLQTSAKEPAFSFGEPKVSFEFEFGASKKEDRSEKKNKKEFDSGFGFQNADSNAFNFNFAESDQPIQKTTNFNFDLNVPKPESLAKTDVKSPSFLDEWSKKEPKKQTIVDNEDFESFASTKKKSRPIFEPEEEGEEKKPKVVEIAKEYDEKVTILRKSAEISPSILGKKPTTTPTTAPKASTFTKPEISSPISKKPTTSPKPSTFQKEETPIEEEIEEEIPEIILKLEEARSKAKPKKQKKFQKFPRIAQKTLEKYPDYSKFLTPIREIVNNILITASKAPRAPISKHEISVVNKEMNSMKKEFEKDLDIKSTLKLFSDLHDLDNTNNLYLNASNFNFETSCDQLQREKLQSLKLRNEDLKNKIREISKNAENIQFKAEDKKDYLSAQRELHEIEETVLGTEQILKRGRISPLL